MSRNLAVAAAVVGAALLSIGVSGFQAGVENNVFHLPILTGLYNEPQFAGDAFIQSLRHYASGFWQVLAGRMSDATVLSLFLPLQILNRIAFFAAASLMGRALGLTALRQQGLFLLLVSIAGTMGGSSFAGNGGLFISTFTHSELANATLVGALACGLERRFAWALGLAGITFFLNMFMAVWLAFGLVAIAAAALTTRKISLADMTRQVLWGALGCLPFLVLPLWSLHNNAQFGAATGFDYRTFLNEYWPDHFLVWEISKGELAQLAAMIAAGFAALSLLPRPQRLGLSVLIASFTSLWIIGAFLPIFSSSPALLNLHLLRSSAVLHMLVTFGVASAVVTLGQSEKSADRLFWAPLLALLLVTKVLLPAALVAILVRRVVPIPPRTIRPAFALLLIGVATCVVAVRTGKHMIDDAKVRDRLKAWTDTANWAHGHTDAKALFLVPVRNLRGGGSLPPGDKDQIALSEGEEVFETFSHRRIWVGSKEGAAVMWQPAYRAEWRSRLADALQLTDLPARLAYARTHGIDVVIDRCMAASSPLPVYRSGPLCAYGVARHTS